MQTCNLLKVGVFIYGSISKGFTTFLYSEFGHV